MRARLLLLAAALVAFGASLGSGFHFDDYAIFSDASLQSARGWLEIWSLRQTRPLTYLSFWLNGRDPAAMHAVNLLLHLAAVLLAYECLRRLVGDRAGLAAAAIFAVHPLQAEAVDYIWGRSIVLAAAFCFASLLSWLTGRRWVAVAWFAAALLAKEEAAAFPLVLWWLDGRRDRGKIAAMLALSLAAGLRVIYAIAVTPGAPAGVQAGITPWHYFVAQGAVLWRYLRLLVAAYGFTVDPQIAAPPAALGLAGWAAIAVGVALMARRFEKAGFWMAAGFVLLLPSSSIFPAADLAADRRMYLPMFAFAAAAALLLERVKWRWAPAAVVAALAAVSVARTQVWMSDERLWREAVERAPDKVRPKVQLSRNVAPAEALTLLAEARRLAPNDPAVAAETGKVLLAAGRPAEALAEFGRALALAPRDAGNFNNRGVALAALGQSAAARQDFERALALDPSLAGARENLRKLEGR
ncbi:MAG TPA: tetratricopeptide repeat protein [Candidatus Sulfopaludibacter sp.]|nr:tetratricopeptide repeat protein [Candidatus Sulfopaludibacter sp.]